MNKLMSNLYGVLINAFAIGFNINELYDRFILNISEVFKLVNVNTILTIIISLLAIVWWRIKIKDMKCQKQIHDLELKKKRLDFEKDQAKYVAEKLNGKDYGQN